MTVAEDPELGTILVDGDGLTLYLFTQDGPNTPTCTGGCALTWPPLRASLVHLDLAGEGVNPDLFATVALADDTSQVTYNGHPLYNYSGDRNPGDTFGNKVGSTWFVGSPEGEPVTGSEVAPLLLEDGY